MSHINKQQLKLLKRFYNVFPFISYRSFYLYKAQKIYAQQFSIRWKIYTWEKIYGQYKKFNDKPLSRSLARSHPRMTPKPVALTSPESRPLFLTSRCKHRSEPSYARRVLQVIRRSRSRRFLLDRDSLALGRGANYLLALTTFRSLRIQTPSRPRFTMLWDEVHNYLNIRMLLNESLPTCF